MRSLPTFPAPSQVPRPPKTMRRRSLRKRRPLLLRRRSLGCCVGCPRPVLRKNHLLGGHRQRRPRTIRSPSTHQRSPVDGSVSVSGAGLHFDGGRGTKLVGPLFRAGGETRRGETRRFCFGVRGRNSSSASLGSVWGGFISIWRDSTGARCMFSKCRFQKQQRAEGSLVLMKRSPV